MSHSPQYWLSVADEYEVKMSEVEGRILSTRDDHLKATLGRLLDALKVNRDQALRFTVRAAEGWN